MRFSLLKIRHSNNSNGATIAMALNQKASKKTPRNLAIILVRQLKYLAKVSMFVARRLQEYNETCLVKIAIGGQCFIEILFLHHHKTDQSTRPLSLSGRLAYISQRVSYSVSVRCTTSIRAEVSMIVFKRVARCRNRVSANPLAT